MPSALKSCGLCLFEPVDVDARSCDLLQEVEPAFAPLGLVSVVEEDFHATLQLDTRHAILGEGRTHERSSRPYLLL